jgi:uncharacterized protein
LSPTRERIAAIDTLRGVAVLGILLINIFSFGLPAAAEDDPTVYGGASGANLATWFVLQVCFEGKMRALFSMLFGAGVVLFTVSRGQRGDDVADLYYRRTLWLTVFGGLHAKFLWEGDILFIYGAVGVVLFLFRRVRPLLLLALGVVVLSIGMTQAVVDALETRELRASATESEVARREGRALTEDQEKALKEWEEKRNEAHPSAEEIEQEIQERRGGYRSNYRRRALLLSNPVGQTFADELLDAAGAMLIGMSLFKLGLFSAARSHRFYVGLLILGYSLGVPLAAYVSWRRMATGFEPGETDLLQAITYHPTRLAIALAHAAAVMLLVRSGRLAGVVRRLAAVGRMALTNYLMQTVLCTTIFYGYGLGWFGYLSRAQLLLVVAAVWMLELAWSAPWLYVFQFGPAEWLWRWLTYLRRPPLLRLRGEPDAEQAVGTMA